jgi:SAM-dependent methyltransferase
MAVGLRGMQQKVTGARELQKSYYTRTAAAYDAAHENEPEHRLALAHISSFVDALGIRSVLDVGTGTGRALRHLAAANPDLHLRGVEPVASLRERAIADHGVPADWLVEGSGEALPFPAASFDAVCEIAVLHHVPDPHSVVEEMMRVARRAIFLSDENRFGHGSLPARLAKVALWKAGAWSAADRVRTRGRGYMVSEGDGVSWSYSVYDSYDALHDWADRIVLIPTLPEDRRTWLSPLLSSSKVLLCAVRDR